MEKKKVVSSKRKTVGQASQEVFEKSILSPHTHSVEEQSREQLSDYEKNVLECAENYRKDHPSTDFFVVVITKIEKAFVARNVIRNYFLARRSCPLPNYDETVFLYTHEDENIRLLWALPNRDACMHIKENPLSMKPEEKQLVQFVLDFSDGTLGAIAKKLNNEDVLKTGIVLTLNEGES